MDTKALRQKILDLAIRGKLVPQDPNDEPASVLLERIRAEKQQMVKDGKLKPKDIKNDTVIFKDDDNLHYEKFSNGENQYRRKKLPSLLNFLPASYACDNDGVASVNSSCSSNIWYSYSDRYESSTAGVKAITFLVNKFK